MSSFPARFFCDTCLEGNPLIWLQAPAGADLGAPRSCLVFVPTRDRCHVKHSQRWPTFPALEAVLESVVTLQELSGFFFFFLRINSAVELLMRSQKTQVQAQFHTCVSAGRRSWHTIAVISYVHCGNTSPAEDEDFIMLCRDVSSLTCSWASLKALTQPVPVHEGLLRVSCSSPGPPGMLQSFAWKEQVMLWAGAPRGVGQARGEAKI